MTQTAMSAANTCREMLKIHALENRRMHLYGISFGESIVQILMQRHYRRVLDADSQISLSDNEILFWLQSFDDQYEMVISKTVYSRAWTHIFENSNHLATLLAHQQSVQLIADFLKGGCL